MFEYRVEVANADPTEMTALLNQWAAEGWRLCHMQGMVLPKPGTMLTGRPEAMQASYCVLEREKAT